MSMFIAWAGLIAFAALSIGLSVILKRINRDSQHYRDLAIREEGKRNQSQDRHRFRK